MRKTLSLLLLLPSFLCAENFSGKVVGVMDGDTVEVMHNGRGERVRLHGVDSPEKAQGYGSAAKKFTSERVFGKIVTVEPVDIDRYGRTVGIIHFETLGSTRNLNQELVSGGMAWWYSRYAPKDDGLKMAELEARQSKRGLWADPHSVPPWEFRRNKRPKRVHSF